MNKLNYKREGITYEQKIKSNQFIKGKYKIGQVIKTNYMNLEIINLIGDMILQIWIM